MLTPLYKKGGLPKMKGHRPMCVYLDNAATTYPKPPATREALVRAMEQAGGNPGRSGHSLCRAAEQVVYDGRCAVASLFGSDAPERVVFTHNATYALNLAIRAVARSGDHLLLSPLEHNAVLRPVNALVREGACTYTSFPCPDLALPRTMWEQSVLSALAQAVQPNTKAVIVTHTSNICGVTFPLQAIGDFCQSKGILFLVDASQSAGILPIDATKMHIDALCFPAHKGLYGISGCGAILFSQRLWERSRELYPLISGGSGVHSLDTTMPEWLPERLEAGTLPTACIAALGAGISFVQSIGVSTIGEREARLGRWCKERIACLPHYTVFAPNHDSGVVSFRCDLCSCTELASYLDGCGICVRGGLHCAPMAHLAIGSGKEGTVRVSFGAFNQVSDIEVLLRALRNVGTAFSAKST